LKYATQAGGRLQDKDRIYFWEMFQEQSKHFIVMYGQTEATARISITPHAMLKEHISTAGIVVKSGNISIENVGPDGTGEIYFKGPNVMMGYAESKFDLSLGDIQEGELETGDLGYLKENMLFITGRTKRIVKIFGKRVSLDDVDARLTKYGRGVAVQSADKVTVFMTSLNEGFSANDIRHDLSEYLSVNIRGVDIREIDQLPLLKSGKIDTLKLQEQA
jgi:acyl-CoA synthetase (AMP-forming)/AMP-acid ligase II